jgi:hypothetical protein
MKKTQPLSTMPEPVAPVSPIKVAPAAVVATPVEMEQPEQDTIPMSLCWGLLGVSAIVLAVQIWNYFS